MLGSNIGDSEKVLSAAIELIELEIGKVIDASSVYSTKAWGVEDQPDFLNQVVEIESNLDPENLLVKINEIEKKLGRVRFQKWHSRIIDIDILYFGAEIIDTPNLVIPHPENQNRNFVLIPMAEIAPELIHPVLGISQKELLLKCADPLEVRLMQSND